MRVTLYSRPNCGLCNQARAVIEAVQQGHSFDLEEIDITATDDLELEYGLRIPVVLIDGEEAFELQVTSAELAQALRDARAQQAR